MFRSSDYREGIKREITYQGRLARMSCTVCCREGSARTNWDSGRENPEIVKPRGYRHVVRGERVRVSCAEIVKFFGTFGASFVKAKKSPSGQGGLDQRESPRDFFCHFLPVKQILHGLRSEGPRGQKWLYDFRTRTLTGRTQAHRLMDFEKEEL